MNLGWMRSIHTLDKIEGSKWMYIAAGYLPDLAVKLQTLAEKCLIPIYKLPKFAVSLLDNWQIPNHDIHSPTTFY